MSTVPRQPLKRNILAVRRRTVGLAQTLDAHYPVKRARTSPNRFEDKIPLPRGGTMRDRTLEERLLQVAFFAAEGDEIFGNCMSIFLPLFVDAEYAALERTDNVDEHSLSLLLSRAHLRQEHEMQVSHLQEKLTACIRAQYVHLVFEELQSVRLRIIMQQQQLRLRTKALGLAHSKMPVAAATTLVPSHHVMLNPEEHVRILTRLMAEETVAEQEHDFMCPLSHSVMLHPVATSCGTMYDRTRCEHFCVIFYPPVHTRCDTDVLCVYCVVCQAGHFIRPPGVL